MPNEIDVIDIHLIEIDMRCIALFVYHDENKHYPLKFLKIYVV